MLTCCFTGHRTFSRELFPETYDRLLDTIKDAYSKGYTNFIIGAADGLDYEAAYALNFLKQLGYKITVESAVPYPQMLEKHTAAYSAYVADKVTYVCEKSSAGSYLTRDRYMVDNSSLVIAVYDGRKSGGTLYTMNYAKKIGNELIVIRYDKKSD